MRTRAGNSLVTNLMKDKYFLDTNILVYTFDKSSPLKQKRSRELVADSLSGRQGCISYQVVQEFLNVATRKFDPPLSKSDAQSYLINVLEPLCEVFASTSLYYQALEVSDRWGYSFYDSLIIGGAISTDCAILYSEDLQPGQEIEKIRIVDPFARD